MSGLLSEPICFLCLFWLIIIENDIDIFGKENEIEIDNKQNKNIVVWKMSGLLSEAMISPIFIYFSSVFFKREIITES